MYLFDVASRHMTWLTERQLVTAGNIANADTPGYKARELNSFESHLNAPQLQLVTTSPLHISLSGQTDTRPGTQSASGWGTTHSGNSVSIERELMTANSTNRMMSVDSSLLRSFHRMLLTSVKV